MGAALAAAAFAAFAAAAVAGAAATAFAAAAVAAAVAAATAASQLTCVPDQRDDMWVDLKTGLAISLVPLSSVSPAHLTCFGNRFSLSTKNPPRPA